jgi:hypothetical protein
MTVTDTQTCVGVEALTLGRVIARWERDVPLSEEDEKWLGTFWDAHPDEVGAALAQLYPQEYLKWSANG